MTGKEKDFYSSYNELQRNIRIYKNGLPELIEALRKISELYEKQELISYIKAEAHYLKCSIERLDKAHMLNREDGLYLSYIEPELQELILKLDNLKFIKIESLFNRNSKAIVNLIEDLEYSEKINIKSFI
jgi:hypothetical protein